MHMQYVSGILVGGGYLYGRIGSLDEIDKTFCDPNQVSKMSLTIAEVKDVHGL